jgi:hypothetical protein
LKTQELPAMAAGSDDGLLRLNSRSAGASGRRKFCLADWDGDGRLDILINSTNVNWLRNIETRDGRTTFEDQGSLSKTKLAGHDTSPTVVHWNPDGIPDLLIGAEDGHFYFLTNPRHAAGTLNKTPEKRNSP